MMDATVWLEALCWMSQLVSLPSLLCSPITLRTRWYEASHLSAHPKLSIRLNQILSLPSDYSSSLQISMRLVTFFIIKLSVLVNIVIGCLNGLLFAQRKVNEEIVYRACKNWINREWRQLNMCRDPVRYKPKIGTHNNIFAGWQECVCVNTKFLTHRTMKMSNF